jgi:hypothetical protein
MKAMKGVEQTKGKYTYVRDTLINLFEHQLLLSMKNRNVK